MKANQLLEGSVDMTRRLYLRRDRTKVNKWIPMALLAMLLCGTGAYAQQPTVLRAASDEGAIILRWAWPKGSLYPHGYYRIYRSTSGEASWTLVTPEPVTRIEDKERARTILGEEAFKKYEAVLFPGIPHPKEDPVKFRQFLTHKEEWWAMSMLTADLHPDVADLLGVRYVDRSAEKGKSYHYRLAYVEKGKERILAEAGPVRAMKQIIAAPQEVEGDGGDASVVLRWKRESRFTSYDVYRAESEGGKTVKVNKLPVVIVQSEDKQGVLHLPEWFYVDVGLVNGRFYWYTIRGRDPFGRESEPSRPIKLVPEDLTAPSPPAKLAIRVEGETVTLTWERPSEADLAGYNVYRSQNYKSGFEKIVEKPLSPDSLEYVDKGLRLGQSYWYYVTALDTSGNESGPSYTALANVIDRVPPEAPEGLQGKAEPGKVLLAWAPNREEDLAGYRVYRSTKKGAKHYQLLNQKPMTETSLVHELPETASAEPFYFKVTAVDTSGNESDFSDIVEVQLPDVTPPNIPVLKGFHVDEGSISVAWYPNVEEDLAGYNLYREEYGVDKGSKVRLNKQLLSKDTLEFVDKEKLIPGRKYSYTLEAVDRSGNISPQSRHIVASTYDKTPPEPPGRVRAKSLEDGGGILLTWKMPDDSALKGVVVYRSREKEGIYRPVTKIIKQTEHLDSRIREGNEYFYRLVAYDNSNNKSEFSETAHAVLKKREAEK